MPEISAQKPYKLRDEHNRPYDSTVKGTLGGNEGLRIYGTLDCPSAKRWLAKGHYRAVRVFFANEATAIAAGYRPCGICMPAEYTAWQLAQPKP